jgi:hypothetical protein
MSCCYSVYTNFKISGPLSRGEVETTGGTIIHARPSARRYNILFITCVLYCNQTSSVIILTWIPTVLLNADAIFRHQYLTTAIPMVVDGSSSEVTDTATASVEQAFRCQGMARDVHGVPADEEALRSRLGLLRNHYRPAASRKLL